MSHRATGWSSGCCSTHILDFAPRVAYWGGNGGSMAFVDLDRRMSFGYAQNRWIRGPYELDRCRVLLTAVYESLTRLDETRS
jgi:hypothetical protein